MSAMAVVIFALAPDFVQLFRNDAEVIDIGAKVLRYECIAMPFLGFIIVMNMFLQNIRRVIPASILAMARQGIVFIPVLMILSNTLRLTGLTMAQGISDLITFLLALPLGLPVLKELKELEKNGNRNKD